MVLHHEPRRVGQHKEIPPAKITRQRQARILSAETGGRQKLAKKQLARIRNRKYRPGEKTKPDQTVAIAKKRLAPRFYQTKTGHCLTGQHLAWTTRRPDATCWWC